MNWKFWEKKKEPVQRTPMVTSVENYVARGEEIAAENYEEVTKDQFKYINFNTPIDQTTYIGFVDENGRIVEVIETHVTNDGDGYSN